MKEFGKLIIDDVDNKIKIYFYVNQGEIQCSCEKDFFHDGYVSVFVNPFFPGTAKQFDRFLYNSVNDYLIKTGIVKKTDGSDYYELVVEADE